VSAESHQKVVQSQGTWCQDIFEGNIKSRRTPCSRLLCSLLHIGFLNMSDAFEDHHDAKEHITSNSKPVTSPSNLPLIGEKSPGVARIEALNAHTSFINRCCIFFGIFLVAYAYGLDGTLRYTYQPYATAGFQEHSTLATISRSGRPRVTNGAK
jgi:hypothetical protein